MTDLTDAIRHYKQSVDQVEDTDPARAGYLSSLGLALQLLAEATGQAVHLDEAIEVGRQAVEGAPTGSQRHAMFLSHLGLAYRLRFERFRGLDDLDTAIRLGLYAVTAQDPDSPQAAEALLNLSKAQYMRGGLRNDEAELRQAMQSMRTAVEMPAANRQLRLQAAVTWGNVAAELCDWPEALAAYRIAVELLPLAAWHGLEWATRQHQLATVSGLGPDAAACALTAGNLKLAVQLLEQSRSVLWSQLLGVRTDRAVLHEAAPALAARLDELAREFDVASPSPTAAWTSRRSHLAAEWDRLIDQARTLPGLSEFARLPDIDLLLPAGDSGPVVIVNISWHRCDAIVVMSSQLRLIPLPDLTAEAVNDRVTGYLSSMEAAENSADYQSAQQTILDTLAWLWDAVAKPVLTELDLIRATGTSPAMAADLPRLWWCPTGALALLPLHAATLDHVVSSYTSTVAALVRARQLAAAETNRVLIIANPAATASLPALPGARAEAAYIARQLPDQHTLLVDSAATEEEVLDKLPLHSAAHFACHALCNHVQPTLSAVHLHDEKLSVARVVSLKLTAELAFLSACRTVASGGGLPDEAIHLAAALHTIGYRHAIGTLWQILDNPAAKLVDLFYQRLRERGRLDLQRAASALHDAVAQTRTRYPDKPIIWAPYVHLGP